MAVITITREARCGDCVFLKQSFVGKRKYHFCNNNASPEFKNKRKKKDPVCKYWSLTTETQ